MTVTFNLPRVEENTFWKESACKFRPGRTSNGDIPQILRFGPQYQLRWFSRVAEMGFELFYPRVGHLKEIGLVISGCSQELPVGYEICKLVLSPFASLMAVLEGQQQLRVDCLNR